MTALPQRGTRFWRNRQVTLRALGALAIAAAELLFEARSPERRLAAEPNPASVIGPLRVADGGRHLVAGNGDPFLWLGDTPWRLFTAYSPQETLTYLADRRNRGFSVVQAVLCWPVEQTCERNHAGQHPFAGGDPARPNDDFFQHVDWVVDQANQHGIIVAILPVWSHNLVSRATLVNERNARAYGAYLGARYASAANIVWVLGGDSPVYDKGNVHRQLAEGIRAADTGKKLITYHPSADPSANLGGTTVDPRFNPFGANEPALDFNMAQSWAWSDDVLRLCELMYGNEPVKPAVLAEGTYERGEYPTGRTTAERVRREAWSAILSGAGYTYGHDWIWQRDTRWQQALSDPAATSMTVLHSVLSHRRWWRLAADRTLLAEPAGGNTRIAARSLDDDALWVYFSQPGSATIRTPAITSASAYSVLWINPATGEELPGGDFPIDGYHEHTVPDGWKDALLLLEGWKQLPAHSPVESGNFVLGVNLNGPPVVIEGQTWLSHEEGIAQGLAIEEAYAWSGDVGSRLRPEADSDTALMLSSVIWRANASDSSGLRISVPAPNGTYKIYLWLLENFRSYHRVIDVELQDKPAVSGIGRLQRGNWMRYGPLTAEIGDGLLRMHLVPSGRDEPLLAGFALYAQ